MSLHNDAAVTPNHIRKKIGKAGLKFRI